MFNMATISNIRNLDLIHENFSRILFNLQPSDNKVIVVKVLNNDNRLAGKEILLHLSIKASELRINDRHIKLVSLQNIKPELDAKELDSWQKLIRVLTHEIMNTITPITSLSSAIAVLFQHNNKVKPVSELDDELIVETVEALNLIEERGKTLISFVDKYRRLSRLPQPIFKPVSIAELVQTAYMLMASELKQRNITTSMEIAEADMNVNVDAGQINQVLINLIKNSMEALANTTEPRITIRAIVDNDNRSLVQVIDNGKGISDEIMDAIFIPFFTTKEEGSGIGLSLSRQIMRLHGGTITANSIPHRETVFTLIF